MNTKENDIKSPLIDNLLKKFELMESTAENLTAEDIRENIGEFKDSLFEIHKTTKKYFLEFVQRLIEVEENRDEIRKFVAETEKELEKSKNLFEELEKNNRELLQELELYRTQTNKIYN